MFCNARGQPGKNDRIWRPAGLLTSNKSKVEPQLAADTIVPFKSDQVPKHMVAITRQAHLGKPYSNTQPPTGGLHPEADPSQLPPASQTYVAGGKSEIHLPALTRRDGAALGHATSHMVHCEWIIASAILYTFASQARHDFSNHDLLLLGARVFIYVQGDTQVRASCSPKAWPPTVMLPEL